ncbi:DUF3999 family protein [Pedobacter punctiformis]|uniref:DUF3999 family protein n=1 Tax=Pedobacter punctiformis TaxID=3004097 RepID=A0ABT4L978_9SPHI|nr:DUF3999 family protein [Pedobacter sp. HCMS5-2]MCZ4244483.1 DUF3999 family protein [Pedobacter sp. HCMS5-2]
MMLKLKIKLFIALLFFAGTLQAQVNQYQYKRTINEVSSTWHNIELPAQVFKNLAPGFEDIRIYGFNGKDTIEVPYLIKQRSSQTSQKEILFNLINKSNNQNGYYFTLQASKTSTINQIDLSFKQNNFDWKATLEGSNNGTEWFTILKDYRILSIKNKDTDYQFTKLNFSDAAYSYFRIQVKSPELPTLLAAKTLLIDTVKGLYQDVKYSGFELKNDNKTKQSIIEVTLANAVPISFVKINAQSDFDFYRPIKIELATDSFKTDKGIQYNFTDVYNGVISSLENPEFNFKNTISSRLRITIENYDNRPLRLNPIQLKGNVYDLVARFDNPKLNYALYYGNNKAASPDYDIARFENKIPSNPSALSIGNEEKNPSYNTIVTAQPLFSNKNWLWALMVVIIALLGWFSYKMLKN